MLSTTSILRLTRHRVIRAAAPIFILFVAWLLFFWRILTPVQADRLTFQQGDFTLQFLAYREIAYRQVASGHFPVFEECLYSGYPFQADPQSQVLYPPVIGAMLAGRILGWSAYPLRALEWEVMLHVLIAATGMYVFLRSLRLRRTACLAGSMAFAFGGFMTGYAMLQTAILETAAWLPWIFFALRHLATAPASAGRLLWVRDALLLAAFVALAYTAGHPQTLLFIVYSGAFAYMVWSWQAHRSLPRIMVRGIVAAVLTLGLSAAQLLPSLSFMLASTRAQLPFTQAGTGFALHDISLFALTGVTNVWQPLYVGIATLVAAVIGMRSRRPDIWMWLAIGAGALILSFGINAFGFDLAYLAGPGYQQFHSQERHAVIISFAVCVLAAYGANTLFGPLRRRLRNTIRRYGVYTAAIAALLLVALLVLLVYARTVDPNRAKLGLISDHIALFGIALLGSAGLLLWRSRLGHTPRWLWAGVFLSLVVFDLFTANRYTATQAPAEPFQPLPLAEPVIKAEGLPESLQKSGAYRLYNHYGLPLNGTCVNHLSEISGGSPIVLKTYQTFLSRTPEDVYSRLLNVWYTVTWRGGMGTDNGKRIPDRKLATGKYQNIDANTFLLDWPAPQPQPAWVVTKTTIVRYESAVYRRLNAADFDPLAEAVIYQRDQNALAGSGSGTAGLEGKSTGYMKIAAHANAPALLMVSEAYHWNWIALVNGKEVKPVIADGALLSIPIPAGNSVIELSYRPLDLYAGVAISVFTLMSSLIVALVSRRHKTE